MSAVTTAPSAAAGGATSDVLTAALAYVARGWRVVALHTPTGDGCSCGRDCASPGKHPRTPWRDRGSADPERVGEWWQRWPDAGVGVVTGAVSGLVVLDIDGADGLESVAALQRRYGALPEPGWARTGSGGWHLYLAHPGGELANTARRLGAGLDTRGDGGMVVAPPSAHACGGAYAWVTEPTPAHMPGWLEYLLRPPERPRAPRLPARRARGDVLAPLARTVADATAGSRNGALFWAACRAGEHVARGDCGADDATAALLDAADACGLVADDGQRGALATIRSGLQRGGGGGR